MLYLLTLNWDNKERLVKLKNSLLSNLTNLSWTWLIKDNASSDGSVEEIKSWNSPNIICLPYKNNLQNFSEGMNYLFNVATPQDSDHILLLNNDVVFNDSTSIQNMMNIINKDNQVGVVGAKLLYTGTNKLQHAGVVFEMKHHLPTHFRTNQVADINSSKNREFQCVTGAILLTKAEYYKNICTTNKSGISGMAEALVWCFDDIDATLSIKYNMEKKIVYCGNTNIFHEESASLKKLPANKLFMNHNINYLRNKWRGRYIIDQDIYNKDPKYNLYKGG